MELNTTTDRPKEKQLLECSSSNNRENKCTETDSNAVLFVNNAAVAWHKIRRDWVGEKVDSSQRMQRDPIISWSMTYEDLLSTNDPFPEQIPLPEMVDFLVDIWHDEGLYD